MRWCWQTSEPISVSAKPEKINSIRGIDTLRPLIGLAALPPDARQRKDLIPTKFVPERRYSNGSRPAFCRQAGDQPADAAALDHHREQHHDIGDRQARIASRADPWGSEGERDGMLPRNRPTPAWAARVSAASVACLIDAGSPRC